MPVTGGKALALSAVRPPWQPGDSSRDAPLLETFPSAQSKMQMTAGERAHLGPRLGPEPRGVGRPSVCGCVCLPAVFSLEKPRCFWLLPPGGDARQPQLHVPRVESSLCFLQPVCKGDR